MQGAPMRDEIRTHMRTAVVMLTIAALPALSAGPRSSQAREGKWEVRADGSQQVDDIVRLRSKKEAQEDAVRRLVDVLWSDLYEVYVSDSTDIQTYNQFAVPDKVRYSIPVRVRYNSATLEEARRILASPDLTGGEHPVSITLPTGQVTIYLYDEVRPIFDSLSDGGRWPFQCRVVLLDENQEVLGRSDSVLYVYVQDLNLTSAPWVGSFQKAAAPPDIGYLGEIITMNAGTEGKKLLEDLQGFLSHAESHYYLESSDRITFDYLSLDILDRVASIRVLRPDAAPLLYRGA